MPTTRQIPSQEHKSDRAPSWIRLASMFVGRPLDKAAAIGAYVAAAATLVASASILLLCHTHH